MLATAAIGSSLTAETVRLLVGVLGNRLDPATVMAAPPLLYNYDPAVRGETLVPDGGYDATFLKNLEAAGMHIRTQTKAQVATLKGTVVIGLIDADGTRRTVETPGVNIFAFAYVIYGNPPACLTVFPFESVTFPRVPRNTRRTEGADMTGIGNPLISLEAVTKVFNTDEMETHALAGIHLDIQRGEYIAISGPSGCGKSTLLAILGLLDSPSNGSYTLNGKRVDGMKMSERARVRNREIGFIFQAFNLIGDLNVYENVELPLTYRSVPSSERKKMVHDALEKVGMLHRVRHYPAQLSGGQQQRVAVARALAGSPSILLADEPTGNLDSANGEAVMTLLSDLHREGATICMVTHDPRYALRADRTITLFDGRVVEEQAALAAVM